MMPVDESAQVCLSSDILGSGPPLLLLHGLFASKSNLRGLAKALSADFEVHSLDLPLHGASAQYRASTIEEFADAVMHYCVLKQLSNPVVLGHSLGGKVAMSCVNRESVTLKALVVVDIAPVLYQASHAQVFQAIERVIEAQPVTREAARSIVQTAVQDSAVVEFLLTQLRRGDSTQALEWQFDAKRLQETYPELLAAPRHLTPSNQPTLFIRGAESNYIGADETRVIRSLFAGCQIVALKGAGHWPHIEAPDAFLAITRQFLLNRAVE